jgi:hypothetical protein
MNSHKRLQTVIFDLLFVMFSTSGCAVLNALPFMATATPYPTYTPYPTFTPPSPTVTLVPERWSVKVISTVMARGFGVLYFTDEQKAEFLIITIEYTYLGQKTTEFSPMSVVLLFPAGSTYPGGAIATTFYQSESNSTVTNFTTEAPILTYIKPGQTKIEKFGWGLTSDGNTHYAGTKLRLLFPETKSIDITIGN